MNDQDKERDQERDKELDGILDPLRSIEPDQHTVARWAKVIHHEAGRKSFAENARKIPKSVEWFVAASIGFLTAMAMERFVDSRSNSNGRIADYNNEVYSGVDATEMILVAIQE